ncbi:MAG: hypothetical protein R3B97_11325 [Dehalococcoidia bacterium]|nr:hypothetical protein [Dehalococcoidia bacterium]MCB9484541.1 hypothetical protein [Thermoflexaceae bacterium]
MQEAPGPYRRSSTLAGAVVLLLGIGLLVAVACELWIGLKAEAVAGLVRHELGDEGLAQHRADYEQAKTVFVGMDDEVIPAAAAQIGADESQLRTLIDVGYPAVAKVIAEREELLPFAEAGLVNLERQQERFQRADSVPVPGLPAWSSAVLTFLLAAMLLFAGGLVLAGQRPAGLAAAGTVAVLLIAVPFVLQTPWKAEDAQRTLDSLRPTEAAVAQTEDAFQTADAGWVELDERLLPDLASVAGTDRAGLDALLALQFPDIAKGLDAMPGIVERYRARVEIRANSAGDLRTLKSVPIGALGWFAPGYGLLLGCTVAASVLTDRRRGRSVDNATEQVVAS